MYFLTLQNTGVSLLGTTLRKKFLLPALLVALTGGAILLFSSQGETEQAKLPYDYWQTTHGADFVRTLAVRNKMAERDYTA